MENRRFFCGAVLLTQASPRRVQANLSAALASISLSIFLRTANTFQTVCFNAHKRRKNAKSVESCFVIDDAVERCLGADSNEGKRVLWLFLRPHSCRLERHHKYEWMGGNAGGEVPAVDWPGGRCRWPLWQPQLRRHQRRHRCAQRSVRPESIGAGKALPPVRRVPGWCGAHQPEQRNFRLEYFIRQCGRRRAGLSNRRAENVPGAARLDQHALLWRGPEWRAVLNRHRGALLGARGES